MSQQRNPVRLYRFALLASFLINIVLLVIIVFLTTSEDETPETTAASTSAQPIAQNDEEKSATQTAVPTTSPTAEVIPPTATATPTTPTTASPSPTPTATIPPAPTATPAETATPHPTPTPTIQASPTPVSGPDWLRYTNLFRIQAGLPQLRENESWSEGSRLHSMYMIHTNTTGHAEQPTSPHYNQLGDESGQNGNIAASGWIGAPDTWAVDYWMSATFHVVPILNSRLTEAGFGVFRDANSSLKMTATMDVASRRELSDVPAAVSFPILFPQDGGQTWVLKYSLPEYPNPLTACPGFQRPTGAPIVVQIGSGDQTPNVTQSELLQDGAPIQHCVIDETRYVNGESRVQEIGRNILDEQDAVVIIPAQPLQAGSTYSVNVTINGEEMSWQFEAVSPPENY